MEFIEAIILGLIQGLTEFLPISSSAHLRIAGEFLPSATDPGATFTAISQLGTETAVIIYFWGDITRIIGKWFRHFGSQRMIAEPETAVGRLDVVSAAGRELTVKRVLLFAAEILGLRREIWISADPVVGERLHDSPSACTSGGLAWQLDLACETVADDQARDRG